MFEQVFRNLPTQKVKRFASGVPNRLKQGITNAMQASRDKGIAYKSMSMNGVNKIKSMGMSGAFKNSAIGTYNMSAKASGAMNTALYRPAKSILKKMTAGFGRSKMLMGGSSLLGTIAMTTIALMNGGMAHAQDHVNERYMRDARYSSKLLSSTRLGSSTGQPQLNLGNHTGIALALHKGRHH